MVTFPLLPFFWSIFAWATGTWVNSNGLQEIFYDIYMFTLGILQVGFTHGIIVFFSWIYIMS